MCHAVRRLNDMAPFSIFSNYRDRTFEKNIDKWTLTRLAQDKFFTIVTKLKSTKKAPQGYSIEDFSKFLLDFLLTSIIMDFNFELAKSASNENLLNSIGDAPRKMSTIFNAMNSLIKEFNGVTRSEFISEMVDVEKLSMAGLPIINGPPKLLKIRIHEEGITKMIAEFQIKKLSNPLVSPVVKAVFADYNFEPSGSTKEVLKLASVSLLITAETRQNNIVFNFLEIATKTYDNDFKKGNKIYDILNESFECVSTFGAITIHPNNVLCAPLSNCLN